MPKRAKLEIGDRVAFSAAWGKSTGAGHDKMRLRGTVCGLETSPAFAGGPYQYVYVQWDGRDDPAFVCGAALARLKSATFSDTYAGH